MNRGRHVVSGVVHAVETMQHRIAGGPQEVLRKNFSLQFLAHAKGTTTVSVQWSPGNQFLVKLNRVDSDGVNAGVNINQSTLIGCLPPVPN